MANAHSLAGRPREEWQPLEQHLRDTATAAAEFASRWGASDLAYLAGLWHDLGKYAPDWQRFLDQAGSEAPVLGEEQREPERRRGPDHSTAGAIHALREFAEKGPGLVLRFVIAAHHAGLANREELKDRLLKPEKGDRYDNVRREAPADILQAAPPSFPLFLAGTATTPTDKAAARGRFEMFVRMVFSALVDADFLDTERFMDRAKTEADARGVRRRRFRPLREYASALTAHLESFNEADPTAVNVQRRRVLAWCRGAAQGPRGAYSLTVPTGGGKTLSSLEFALKHAEVHGLERVIVALPFLSILDQTADVYRRAFEDHVGVPALIEHHSNVTPAYDTLANRLASENWDAPLVVTTQIQLFESLFSNRPRHCRKLHNLVNSVIILDEVQTLPAELLSPILDQLQQLRAHYGVTLVLTTATQPALHSRTLAAKHFLGLDPAPVEIVPAEAMWGLFDSLRRVEVEWPSRDEPLEWSTLADELDRHPRVLGIVHRRQDAVELWRACEALRPGEWSHLSALMCPAHRRKVLGAIRARLAGTGECRVVSTQLVEAGVDVDFPVVYRAMAGLESLAQSAGRCNREGLLPGKGRFVVFNPQTSPPGLLKLHQEVARVMLRNEPGLDLWSPATFRGYFDMLYATRNLDAKRIQPLRQGLRFEEVARTFQMIDDAGETVFVPYGKEGRKAIQALRHGGPSAARFRELQPFGVTIYPEGLKKLLQVGAVEVLLPESVGIHVLVSDVHYHERLGLLVDPDPFAAIA